MEPLPQTLLEAEAQQETLWQKAPAWRNLTAAASLLTLAAVAIPALLPREMPPPATPLPATEAVSASGLPVGGLVVPSGMLAKVNQHNRHDGAQGDLPVSITIVSPPAHGIVTTQTATALLRRPDGAARNSVVTQVFYQSRAGYKGRDSFSYRRTSPDPSDPLNANTYTMVLDVQ
jgi:hypothetical protein